MWLFQKSKLSGHINRRVNLPGEAVERDAGRVPGPSPPVVGDGPTKLGSTRGDRSLKKVSKH